MKYTFYKKKQLLLYTFETINVIPKLVKLPFTCIKPKDDTYFCFYG